jgi:hypothetical protein
MAEESVFWLDSNRISPEMPQLPSDVATAIQSGTLTGVNLSHPRWREALEFTAPKGFDLKSAALILNNYPSPTEGLLQPYEARVYRWK